MYYIYMNTPVGAITVAEHKEMIRYVLFGEAKIKGQNKKTPLLERAEKELNEYFEGVRTTFSLPLTFSGTEFQKKVWNALLDIPYGETKSYRDIAEAVECKKGFRAVGMANNKNPISIVVP